jgi:homoserine O-acetyltransferase
LNTVDQSPCLRDGTLQLGRDFRLHHGDVLPDARVAYRLIGRDDAPVVAVLGGISSHRVLTPVRLGWWPAMVGDGLAIDTERYRVLGIDYLGGRGDSSAPGQTGRFPPLSAYDQAAALAAVAQELGIDAYHAVIGASYGGMVALCFAERFASTVKSIVVVSAADKPQILATAWRSVQRQIVREALTRGEGVAGLKLARALAMATYRSGEEFSVRFDGAPLRGADGFRFPVEQYLFARGDDYVQAYRPESFLSLSESLDLHRMDATLVRTPATLIGTRGDQLVPFADMQALTAALSGPSRLVEIQSLFGHDAFLKESAALTPIIQQALAEQLS